ncbi:MAG: NAD(P)H-dependent oxidoreductase [Methanobacteriota archaeon]
MKTLVVYFSLTGNTKKVGELIAEKLGADVEEIKLSKALSGMNDPRIFTSFLGCLLGKLPELAPLEHDLKAYDLVVVGGQVWCFSLSTPLKAFFNKNSEKLPEKVAFFLTHGGMRGQAAVNTMRKSSGKTPVATLILREENVKSGDYEKKTEEFAEKISGLA